MWRVDKRKPIRIVSIVALAIVIALVVFLATRVPASQTVAATPLLGKPAPAIQGTVIENTTYNSTGVGNAGTGNASSDPSSHSQTAHSQPSESKKPGGSNRPGESVASSGRVAGYQFSWTAYRGRWVLVDFFASWCPPCQEEASQLLTFAMEHRGNGGVSLVGVAFDDPRANVVSFMQETGVIWPVVLDSSGKTAVDYGVTGPPEAFLVDPAGRIVEHIDGAVTLSLLNSIFLRARTAYDHALASVGGASGNRGSGNSTSSGYGASVSGVLRNGASVSEVSGSRVSGSGR
jgi:thiol-disulfide isomerase/thioredoxin